VSATDVLVPWSPDLILEAGGGRRAEAWDAYLAPVERPEPLATPGAAPDTAEPLHPRDARALRSLRSLEEPLDDASAFAATECLYELVHALGRLDVDAAMAVVADDYHAIDADREVDAGALRHSLEALVDELRGGEVDVSLAELPEAIPYRDGLVLIPATLQIDRRPPDGSRPESRLFEWVAALEEGPAGFRICALSPRRDRPSDPLPAASGSSPR
jgi:hypothetical protein